MQALSPESLFDHFEAIEQEMTDAGKALGIETVRLLDLLRERAKQGGFRNQPIVLHHP